MTRIPPRLAAFLAIVLWGMSFVATKAALQEIAPVTLIFTRFAIGAAALLMITRQLPPRSEWRSLALMGFIGVFVHQMIQAHALTMTSATNTGWLIGLTPIWSAVLSAILLRERFGLWKTVGLIGGFAGALLVMTRGEFSSAILTLPSTRGDLLILLSTFNWAIYTVVGHPTIRRLGATRATTGAILFGAGMLAPFFVAARAWRELPQLSASGWGALLFLGIGCSAAGYLFWYAALDRIEPSRVAVFLYLEPLVTFATAAALLQERVSAVSIIGGLIVWGSVLTAQFAPTPRKTTSPSS